jgi:hypothetical protein
MVLKNRNQGSYLPSLRLLFNVEVNVNVTDGQITRFKLLDTLPLYSAEPLGLADIKCPNITLLDDAKGFTPFVDQWISVSIEPGVVIVVGRTPLSSTLCTFLLLQPYHLRASDVVL